MTKNFLRILKKDKKQGEYEGHFYFKFDEKEWLQNYHYLLTYDKSNLEILIPAKAKGKKSEKNYYN